MDRGTQVTLPPGQHAIEGFPRFGTHLSEPAPDVPPDPTIEIGGALADPVSLPVADLATLPRRELIADFHCVSGWSATGLRWEGVPYATLHRMAVEPRLEPGTRATHLVFVGLDGYRSCVAAEDALSEDVLVADRLDGRPLDGDHGAPARLVSPSQYGFVSTKHLCRIEVHTSDPGENYGYTSGLSRAVLRGPLFQRHPRGRVWEEERHRYLPPRLVRVLYRPAVAPIRWLSGRGSENGRRRRA